APLLRDRDGREQRVDDLDVVADEREDGAVVVRVAVDVQQPGLLGDYPAEEPDQRRIAAFRDVRDGLEREMFRRHADILRRLRPGRGRDAYTGRTYRYR